MSGKIIRTTLGVVGIDTELGWTVQGGRTSREETGIEVLFTNTSNSNNLDEFLKRFWEIEDIDYL